MAASMAASTSRAACGTGGPRGSPQLLPRAVSAGPRPCGLRSGVPLLQRKAVLRPSVPQRSRAVQAKAMFKSGAAPLDPSDPEQVALRGTAGLQKGLSFVAFWLQLALTLAAAGVLVFSVAFTNPGASGTDVPKCLTAVGVVFAFLSTFFAHGFLRLARTLQGGGVVAPGWLTNNLLANNTLNLMGIGATVIGLQASVGTLVAKTLVTSVQTPYGATVPQNALISLDVFALQAATNVLLGHIISLVFTNVMMRVITGAVNRAADPLPPPTMRPSSLGFNPWGLKAD